LVPPRFPVSDGNTSKPQPGEGDEIEATFIWSWILLATYENPPLAYEA